MFLITVSSDAGKNGRWIHLRYTFSKNKTLVFKVFNLQFYYSFLIITIPEPRLLFKITCFIAHNRYFLNNCNFVRILFPIFVSYQYKYAQNFL